MQQHTLNVISVWRDQVESARARGLRVERLLVSPADYMHWWRALGRDLRKAIGDSRALTFGGVPVEEAAWVADGTAFIATDAR